MENLIGIIIESPNTDYACRMVVPRSVLAHFMASLIEELDYGNFKTSRSHIERKSKWHAYRMEPRIDYIHLTSDQKNFRKVFRDNIPRASFWSINGNFL